MIFGVNLLKMNLVDAWIFTWGICYLSCALAKPDIIKSVGDRQLSKFESVTLLLLMGIALIICPFSTFTIFNIKILYLLLGIVESFGCVASFTGKVRWSVKYSPSLAQYVMAVLDLVAAACLLSNL